MFNINIIEKLKLNFFKKKQTKLGIHNMGKNNTFVNNTIEGCDVGFKDEDEGTVAINN